MPKTEIDYSNTIIYKITCKDSNITDVYVGHTTNFVQRKHAHKQSCINDKSPNYNCKLYQVIRNNGGWSNWCMEIVHFCNCNDHYEARKKEQEYFELLHATLNSIEPMPKPKVTLENQKNIIKSNKSYYCNVCNVYFQNSKMMETHNKSKKHIKKQQNISENAKNADFFFCETCDFKCCKYSNYQKHNGTKKHDMLSNANNANIKNAKNAENKTYVCECGKIYKHLSSLCKHKKICLEYNANTYNEEKSENQNDSTMETTQQMDMLINLFQEQLKENKELKELII